MIQNNKSIQSKQKKTKVVRCSRLAQTEVECQSDAGIPNLLQVFCDSLGSRSCPQYEFAHAGNLAPPFGAN